MGLDQRQQLILSSALPMLFLPPGETNNQGSHYPLPTLTMRMKTIKDWTETIKDLTETIKDLTKTIKDLTKTIKTVTTTESS